MYIYIVGECENERNENIIKLIFQFQLVPRILVLILTQHLFIIHDHDNLSAPRSFRLIFFFFFSLFSLFSEILFVR